MGHRLGSDPLRTHSVQYQTPESVIEHLTPKLGQVVCTIISCAPLVFYGPQIWFGPSENPLCPRPNTRECKRISVVSFEDLTFPIETGSLHSHCAWYGPILQPAFQAFQFTNAL